jgi:hypothetical protein
MSRGAARFIVTRTADSVLIAWDNRAVPMRLLPLLLMFLPLAACVWFAAEGAGQSWKLAALLAVPFVLLVGYSLLTRRWREAVELTREAISHHRSGFLAPGPRRYPLAALREIGLGHYPGTGDECEMMRTLNLVHEGLWLLSDRTYIGYWLIDGDLRRVFDELRAFAADAGLPLRFVLYDEGRVAADAIPPNAG